MFGRDPFDPFGTRRQMRQMEDMMDSMLSDSFMDNFFTGFGHPRMGMLEDGNNGRSRRRVNHNNELMSPFGFGGNVFGNMMQQMQMMGHQAMDDPNSHVFHSTTMISYDGNGAPKVVQNSVRKSGDVKETRTVRRDGNNEEIAVGHAIGDREHIIEKKRDSSGRVRKNQRFVNLDEEEAEQFNHEFKSRAHQNLNGIFDESSSSSSRHQAIENGRSSRHSEMDTSSSRRHKKEPQPIIEIPDDDSGDELPPNRSRITYSNSRNGPRISEVTDDDVGNASKRRKLFGRFFANDD